MFTRLRVKDVCVHGLTGNVFLIHVFFLAAYAKVIFRQDLFCCSCLGDRVWWHTVPLELCQSHSDNICTPGGGLCVMGSNRFLLGNQSGKLIGNSCFLSKIPQQQQNSYTLPSKVNVNKLLSFGYVLCCVYSAVSDCLQPHGL